MLVAATVGESAFYEAETGHEVVKFGRKYIIPKVSTAPYSGCCPDTA
jgi:hypothetical protein